MFYANEMVNAQCLRAETAKFRFSMSKYIRIHHLFVVVTLLDGFGGQIKIFGGHLVLSKLDGKGAWFEG